MTWLRFFDSAKAVDFARTISGEFCTVRSLAASDPKRAGRKSDRTIALVRKASGFARSEKLNFYVRAKMLAEIKDSLKNAGIDKTEVDEIVRAIALEALRNPGRA